MASSIDTDQVNDGPINCVSENVDQETEKVSCKAPQVELCDEEKRERTLMLKNQGNSHFKLGQYDSSVEMYLSAVQVCPEEDQTTRVILFSNLAAAKDHLGAHEEAITFCNEALSINDKHTKALLRRAQLYRKCDKLDESLSDYEQYLTLIPDDASARRAKEELKIQIEQRNEKMKTEMLGKLKDLGNIVLKPFGLSTENFQLVKNPENGSYSVNFQNSKQ